ncbi:MAG: hypothetical protein ACKVKV_07525, partial [Dehalococcoidia bacterium]
MAVHDPINPSSEHGDTPPVPVRRSPRFGVVGRSFFHTFESVITNRDFRMIWFGMVLSMGGFQMQMVARGILVYNLTGDAFITGIVG